MKVFKVLGSGCANCTKTAQLIEKIAQAQGVEVSVEKVTDMEMIVGYGVMRTPAVVYEEEVIHAGGIPTEKAILGWLEK